MKNLFENNTGKLVKQLAAKDLRADKRRNIFIISTISFAVCLMVTLALFFLGSSHELKKQLQGRYQAVVIGMSKEEITKAMNDKSLAKVGVEVGINILHIDKFTLNVNYRDKNDVNLRSISIQGQLPKKENEILISRTYLEKIGINPEIGRQVKLSLDETTEKNFTITGIIDDKENRNAYEVIVSESYLQTYYTSTIPYKVLVRYGDSKDIKPDELKTMITSCLQQYNVEEEEIAFSSSYFSSVDNMARDIYAIAGICLLIILACAMVIYSMFYIGVVGKINEYGRFRVIGMTKKQLKAMIKQERNKIERISILLGCCFGCLLGYIIVPKGWNWINTIMSVITIAILTKIVVSLSIRKPMNIAVKISPIEAIRMSSTTETSKNKSHIEYKMSPAGLSKAYFVRNRKKNVITLISLGLTGILLSGAASYLNSIDPDSMARQVFGNQEMKLTLSPNLTGNPDEDPVEVFANAQKNNPFNKELMDELNKKNEIKNIRTVESCHPKIFLPNNVNVKNIPDADVAGLHEKDFDTYQNHLIKGTMKYSEMVSNRGILVDDTAKILSKFANYNVKIGDVIQIETNTGSLIKFTVMGIVNMENTDYAAFNFIIPQELLSNIRTDVTNFNSELLVQTNMEDLAKVENIIYDKLGNNQNINIKSFSETQLFVKEELKSFAFPIYGLVIFIGVFGLINLVNSLSTNLIARQRELGMLCSIGLSKKQLLKMLWWECLYYIFSTMAITISLGTVTGYALCRILNQVGVFGKMTYKFPTAATGIYFALLLIVVGIYLPIALRYCTQKPLVERIKIVE